MGSEAEEADDLRVVPPNNQEAEMALLSALLNQGAAEYHGDEVAGGSSHALFDLARRWIPGSGVFYNGAHARIWGGMLQLREAQKPIDAVLLRSLFRLEIRNGAPSTGDVITKLFDLRISPARAEHYAQEIYDLSEQRALRAMLADAQRETREGGENVVAAVNKLQRGLATFGAIGGNMGTVTSQALSDEAPENREWVVQGMIPARFLTALVSEAKVGKTTLLFHLVRALTTGSNCIGLECKPLEKILWVCEETNESLGQTCRRLGLRTTAVEFITRDWLGKVPWQRAAREIIEKAKAIGAGLVIIDTFAAWAGLRGEEENQVGAVQNALVPLQQATSEGLTFLITHHTNKDQHATGPGKIRGSSAFSGAVDGFLILRKEGGEESPLRSLTGEGRGDGWVKGVRYELDPDSSLRRVAKGGASTTEKLEPALVAAVLKCVVENPGISGDSVRRTVGARNETVLKVLLHLVSTSSLKKVGGEVAGKPGKYYDFSFQLPGN